jgi:CTP synthase
LARHVCNLKGSNSTEFNPKTKYPVIDLLPEQKKVKNMGATMRLGGHDISIIPDTGAYNLYGKPLIRARHRHRYEFNQLYQNDFKLKNIIFSGNSDSGKRMEILELPNHPFFFATQFHPEFTCRPGFPNPIFLEFIRKCLEDNR